jgi:uncharacterized membrane protein YgcG
MIKRLLFLLLFSLILINTSQADERILNFHSDITVHRDGSMSVVETIKVRAEGNNIKRGIFRDFPTDYQGVAGTQYHVAFEVESVLKNGEPENYYLETLNNGMRIYIGRSDVLLSPGEYSYTISYQTNRQLGFYKNHDELYWNVTGNGWDFPIDKASASVHLPSDLDSSQINAEAFTGASGQQLRNYQTQTRNNATNFETTASLSIEEGLTIVVTWPKGYVQEPSPTQQLIWFAQDNTGMIIAIVGLLFLLCYYYIVWLRVGRDPEPGVIIPLYQAPQGFSPGAARYILNMGYDDKTFTVTLVSLAVKGYLKLNQSKGQYSAKRTSKSFDKDLGPGEKALLKTLFIGSLNHSISFKQQYHSRINSAIVATKTALQNNYDKAYFLINRKWLKPGIIFSLITLALAIWFQPGANGMFAIFISIWLSIWSIAVIALVRGSYNAWRHASGPLSYLSAIYQTLFALPFIAGEIMAIGVFIWVSTIPLAVIMAALFATNAVFYQLLKAPTLAGRALLDKLEGLKLYLEVAEKDELKFKHPPEKTPELFETLFPYAMALGVEERWADRFTRVFAELEKQQHTYNPDWYHGGHFSSRSVSQFSRDMGSSLSSAISSSSRAPGSSSGGSSGSSGSSSSGSSGGGGGGGGGGGW